MSTHFDLCVSSVTQKISQNRLRIMTLLRRRMRLVAQAISDPAFNSGGATRTHRSHIGFLSDASRLQAHLVTAVAIQHTRFTSRACTCRASGRGIRRCRPLLCSATSLLLPSLLHCRSRPHPSLTCCRGATRQQSFIVF